MRAALASLVVLAGCGAARTPAIATTPSALVRADVERAEDAERARRHDLARAAYEQAIADAHDPPSQAFARRELAETLETWGEIPAAIAQLDAAVAAVPGDVAAWHDLGILRHHVGDDAGARVALERARQLAPKDPRPRIALAALELAGGDRAAALVEYRGLLELELPERVREKVVEEVRVLERLPAKAEVAPRLEPKP